MEALKQESSEAAGHGCGEKKQAVTGYEVGAEARVIRSMRSQSR